MKYVRSVSGYLLVALLGSPLVFGLWSQYQLREILAVGAGVPLGEYVAPSWHRLASRVRSGELKPSPAETAARFDRIAGFFESESRHQKETAQSEIDLARQSFHWSVGFFLAQVAFAIVIGVTSLRKQRQAESVPSNSA